MSVSLKNQGLLLEVIQLFLQQGRAFTAYDVSKEAQDRGANQRHLHMKDFIHECLLIVNAINQGQYEKTLINVGNQANKAHAYLYHPVNYNPSDYVSNPHAAVPAVLQQPIQMPALPATDGYTTDQRGRLLVPASFVKHVADVGDLVQVISSKSGDETKIYVLPQATGIGFSDTLLSLQTVENHGNIRIGLTCLMAIGAVQDDKFEIEKSSSAKAICITKCK